MAWAVAQTIRLRSLCSGIRSSTFTTKPTGEQICCAREGCKRFKGSYRPVDSSNIVSWNTHGHPNDTARHSTIDGLCEFVWHRQYSHLDLAQFLALDMTPQGRKDIDHYVAELIKIRQEKGPKCRIGNAEWAKVPIPTKLTKETFSQLAIEEPDDIFYTPEDYLKAFSMTPEQGGNACEWVESSKGKVYGCWVAQDAPNEEETFSWAAHQPFRVARPVRRCAERRPTSEAVRC